MMLGLSRAKSGPATLGRVESVLLMALGLTVLLCLFGITQDHRARLAAEVLGTILGAAATILVVGVARPSPQLVTRAYVRISPHTRTLLIAGMVTLFGVAVATAVAHEIAPGLRDVPGLGGLVTLDWVLSLTLLAIAGSTLLFLGLVALVARPTPSAPAGPREGAALERLWAAANGQSVEALRQCFVGPDGEALFGQWLALVGPPGAAAVLLVRSAAAWERSWSEWHTIPAAGSPSQRWLLVATERGGRLAGGQLFQPAAAVAAEALQAAG